MSDAIVDIRDLRKTFRIGFFMKRVEAVRGVSFTVRPGEVFGLLGPNGAGKTTTIKMMMTLIRPTAGSIDIFGKRVPDRSIYREVGFLPENPYFYDYLKPRELLDYAGALFGLSRRARRARAEELLVAVGLAGALDKPLRKFSKGMLQRVGIAQALIADPRLVVLDEPMSGLDPIGRKEVKDLLLGLKAKGVTVLFSSHILTDVETICDRVVIVNRGVVTREGALGELLRADARRTAIEAEGVGGETRGKLEAMGASCREAGGQLVVEVEGAEKGAQALSLLVEGGARIVSVVPHRETLEDIFIRDAFGSS